MAKISLEIVLAGITISKNSDIPIYQQVYEQIRKMIVKKRLLPGDRLPASRKLATDLGVSRTSIIQSFEQLILEGYLMGKPGAGTYISETLPDNLINASSELKKENFPPDTNENYKLNLSLVTQKNEIVPFLNGTVAFDHFPYKIWQHVGSRVLQDLKSYNLGYSSSFGYWPLRKQIADYLRLSRAVNCDVRQVIIVNGSLQGISLLLQYLLKPGDSVWMEDPGYEMVNTAFKNRGVNICPIPIEKDGLDIQYAIEHFDSAKLLYVTPSHQYPLGSTLSIKKRRLLLEYAAQKDFWIVEDDYDSEFRYDGTPLPSLQGLDKNEHVIYTGTFSKVLFPALRIAYLVLPTLKMVEEFKVVKETLMGQSPVIDQIVLAEFMEQGHFLRHLRRMRLLYAERRRILVELITQYLSKYLTIENHNAGMNIIAWVSENIDMDKLRDEAIKNKVYIFFLKDYTISNYTKPGIILGYTAFSKYKMKIGVEKLLICLKQSEKAF